MKLSYNVTGAQRKSLVAAISEEQNAPTKYRGVPTFAYEVGGYHIDKAGTVTGEDNQELVGKLEIHGFIGEVEYDNTSAYVEDIDQHHPAQYADPDTQPTEAMMAQAKAWTEGQPEFEELQMTEREELGLGKERRDPIGEDGMQASDVPEIYTYQAELSDPDCPDRMEVFGATDDEDALQQAYEFCEGEVVLLELFQLDDNYNQVRSVEITPRTDRLTIEIPLDGFTPEKLDNLAKLVNAKAPLLKAALGTDDLPIKQTADTLQFPWFRGEGAIDADHSNAYATLVSLLCKTAIEKKRVTAKEKDLDGSPKYAMRCFLLSLGFIGEEYKTARKILLSRLEGNSSWKNGKKAETEMAGDE
jgi:hypothetical protein